MNKTYVMISETAVGWFAKIRLNANDNAENKTGDVVSIVVAYVEWLMHGWPSTQPNRPAHNPAA